MNGDALSAGAHSPEGGAGSALQALIDALSTEADKPRAAERRADAALDAWRKEIDAKRASREAERAAWEASRPPAEPTPAPETPARAPLRAPPIAAAPFDPEDGFDFSAFIDAVCVDFEAAASPEDTPLPALSASATSVGLDKARAARILAEARDAGCAPEAILASAIDLYFAILDRAED